MLKIRLAAGALLSCCFPLLAFAVTPVTVCSDVPASSAHAAASAPVHADGTSFRAADGRYVMLRGVNAAGNSKVPPFKAMNAPELFDPLPGLGVNTIRLLFTWEAFEPTQCGYSEDYLAYYEQAIKWAAERNMYVIVDFHQDAFSRNALDGCGEGFPLWALTGKVAPATPDNGPACKDWGSKATFSAQNSLVFDRFFNYDDNQALSHYLEMLRRVSARTAQYPNVIAYDIINEPWSNGKTLNPFYRMAGEIIRQNHPSAMLFFEPEMPVMGPLVPIAFSGVTPPPLGNVVLAPHYYSPTVMSIKFWLWEDPGAALSQWKAKTDQWNIPMFLGEFGSPHEVSNSAAYMEANYKWLDSAFVSGTQWSYTPGWTDQSKDGWNMEDLSIVDNTMKVRSSLFTPRPYPQKTAGKPLYFKRHSKGFSYSWMNDPALGNGRTEFYVPDGYQTSTWTSYPGAAKLSCKATSQHLAECASTYKGLVSVNLTRK